MIYKFKSAASGDVIMLGPHGDATLRLLGREPAAKGIVEVADLAGAIASLRAAIESEGRSAGVAGARQGDDSEPEAAVSLRRRLWPIIDMLERAARDEVPVVWGV